MKVSKKTGKVKLESCEVRIGNFFVKCEDAHIKLQDLNGVFTHRVNRRMPIGIWLETMWGRALKGDGGAISTLETYIATMWSFFSVAPDDDFITDTLNAAKSALERHPDWYGVKKESTPEEDAEAVKSVEEMKEFEEDMRKLAEKSEGEK